ncbi:hypothetical protein MY9_4026 [Bacillus sp. JS]|nr:hypothetical protein MY9_4026 [Bacillus sp. JS]
MIRTHCNLGFACFISNNPTIIILKCKKKRTHENKNVSALIMLV